MIDTYICSCSEGVRMEIGFQSFYKKLQVNRERYRDRQGSRGGPKYGLSNLTIKRDGPMKPHFS